MAAADQVVCPFFEVVFERLKSLIYNDQLKKLGPLVKELKKLYTTFCKIKTVINDAERRQFKEEADGIRFWLQQLNDAAYEADDVFDEFEYEALQQIASQGASSSSNNSVIEQLNGKIHNLIVIFHELTEECSGLELQKEKEKDVVISPDRITDPLLSEPKVYGRDEDREKLVKQLLGPDYLTLDEFCTTRSKHPRANHRLVLNSASSSSQDNISVFPIEGMAGLGKTTLAKMVFNDVRVQKHFNFRCWICISVDFDTKRIMKEIVSSLPRRTGASEKLELQRHFHEELRDKRFLVVLDDVWNVTQDDWNEMKAFFRAGAQGSSIVVTTRLSTAACITGTVLPNCISKLSDKECLELFKQYAFGLGNEERPALVKIGEEIMKKCQGLPLAVKALGGLLRFKNEENEWLYVKDNAIWEFENDILPALRLSYYHLSSMLKQCFSFCSIFPKDHKINKEQLIRLWMANGLVHSRAKMGLEDVGNVIFNELLWRSFFQDTENDKDGDIISCKMHDLVHDLACYIGNDEYFVEDGGSKKSITERTRHMFLSKIKAPTSSIPETMRRSSPRLRSLIWSNVKHVTLNSEFIFSDFMLLRALDLHSCAIKVVPDCIGEMIHLRYLNLSDNCFISLPESICLLSNMQALNLRCNALSSLPKDIGNMTDLIHLDIGECVWLTSMPIGIGQLTRLETLNYFIVDKESGSGVDGLHGLNNIRGELTIDGLDGVETAMEGKEANLMSKKNLNSLELCWASDSNSRPQHQPQNVINGFQPHSNLKILVINYYRGVIFSPSWLTALLVPNLVEIRLSWCAFEHLGPLRKLESLKVLVLHHLPLLKFIEEEEEVVVDDASAGGLGFPSLEVLKLKLMPDLEGWSSSSSSQAAAASAGGGFQWLEGVRLEEPMHNLEGSSSSTSQAAAAAPFPCHKSQSAKKLERCPKLKTGGGGGGLPLSLSSSSLSQAAATTQVAAVFPCLKSVTLTYCPKLKGGIPLARSPLQDVNINGYRCNGMVLGSLRDLPCLPSLEISEFDELEFFPPGALTNLTALQKLKICNCDNLKSLPVELNSLTTLTELEISHCPKLVSLAEEREGGLKNLSSLKTLFIYRCPALKRLPQLDKTSLHALRIKDCNVMGFSKEDFEHLVVLEELRLHKLPKLAWFPEGLKYSAATLRHLQFQPCSKYGAAAVDLPDWIGTNLTSLEYLEIVAPENWTVLPQWMKHLTALKDLVIRGCDQELVKRWKNGHRQREDNNSFNMITHIPRIILSSRRF